MAEDEGRPFLDADVGANIMEYLHQALPDDCVFVLAVAKVTSRDADAVIMHTVMSDAPEDVIVSIFESFIRASEERRLTHVERERKGPDD